MARSRTGDGLSIKRAFWVVGISRRSVVKRNVGNPAFRPRQSLSELGRGSQVGLRGEVKFFYARFNRRSATGLAKGLGREVARPRSHPRRIGEGPQWWGRRGDW